ncbi:MAG: TM2 domain-containing protein [Pseudomonadota bacterium]
MGQDARQVEIDLEYARKSKIIAYTLWLGLFGLGAHRMYLNRLWSGICQAVLFLLSFTTFGVSFFLSYGADVALKETLNMTAWVGVAGLAIWVVWTLIDAAFLARWVDEDSEEKRLQLAARY